MTRRRGSTFPAPEQPTLNFDAPADQVRALDSGSPRSPESERADTPTRQDVADDARQDPPVVVRRSARRRRTVTAYREAGNIVVLIPQRMSKADETAYVQEMVAKVLARETKTRPPAGDDDLANRAGELAVRYLEPSLGYCPVATSVSWVTNQNHRWGSCTPASGTIRLSHRMQSMPSWVVDYVLLHELAHLVEAKHSPQFWDLLDGYPAAEKARGYLDGFQAGLASRPEPK